MTAKGCKGNWKKMKNLLTGQKNMNILICQKNTMMEDSGILLTKIMFIKFVKTSSRYF